MSREVKLTFVVDDNGTVRNVLGGAADALRQVERQADESARKTGAAMDMISGGVGRVVAAIGGIAAAYKAVDAVFDQVSIAADLDDIAQRTGVASEMLSKYSLAAQLSGTSLEGLSTGFRILSRNISEGDQVLAGVLRTSTDALRMRDLTGVVNDLAGVFERLPDGAMKTRLSMELMGRSGSELIPFFNQGREGLIAFGQAAERAGVVMSTQTTQAAAQLMDTVDILRANLRGLAVAAAEGAMPALQSLATETLMLADANGGLIRQDIATWANGAATAIAALAPAVREAYGWFNSLSQAAANFYVGEGGGLLTDAARLRAGANPGMLSSMSDEARGFMSVGTPDIRLPPAARAGGAIDNAELRRVRGILGSAGGGGGAGAGSADPMTAHVDAWLNRSVIEAKALNDEMAALAGTSDRASLGVSQIEQHLGGARGEASMFVQTFSDGLLSVFDALLSSGGKFDLLEVSLRTMQRSFLQTFAEALPGYIEAGLGSIQSMLGRTESAVNASTNRIAGEIRNSPVGDLTPYFAGSGGAVTAAPAVVSVVGQSGDRIIIEDEFGGRYSATPGDLGTATGAATGLGSTVPSTQAPPNFAPLGSLIALAAGPLAGAVSNSARVGQYTQFGASGGLLAGLSAAALGAGSFAGPVGAVLGGLGGFAYALATQDKRIGDKYFEGQAGLRQLLVDSRLARTDFVGDSDNIGQFALTIKPDRFFDPVTGEVPDEVWSRFLDYSEGELGGAAMQMIRDSRRSDKIKRLAMSQLGVTDEAMLEPALGRFNRRMINVQSQFSDRFDALSIAAGHTDPQARWSEGLSARAAVLGLSPDMIEYELKTMVGQLGLDMETSIRTLNEGMLQYLDEPNKQAIASQDIYNARLIGAIQLFSDDLPNGVNAVAIAMAAMEQTTRGSIVNLDKFNEEIGRATAIGGALQSALTGGVSGALDAGVAAISSTGSFDRSAMRTVMRNAIRSGGSSAIVSALTNSITDSALFKDANSLLYQSISSGDASGVSTALAMFGDVTELAAAKLDALVPVIDAFGRAVSESTAQAGQYYSSARDVARARQQYVFGTLTPRGQLAAAGQSFGRLESKYAAIMADGQVTADEVSAFEAMYNPTLGQLQSVEGGLTQGSAQWRAVNNQVLSTFGFYEDLLKAAGDTITYREVNAGRLTVDELIVKNVGGGGGGTNYHGGRSDAATDWMDRRGIERGGQTEYIRSERQRNRMR